MNEEYSLAEVAYKRLEEDIVTLKLQPGEALTETRLSQTLNMGRTPIREAVQRLSWEGLVSIRPRLGMVISELNPGDYTRVMDARHPLEVLLATSAARLASRTERHRLHDCTSAMRDAAAAKDMLAFMRMDKTFDEIIGRASCNPFAAKAVAPLQTLSRRFWFRYMGESDLTAAATCHLDLMQAIGKGDEQATRAMAEELMRYMRRQAVSLIAEVSFSS